MNINTTNTLTFLVETTDDIEREKREAPSVVEMRAQHPANGNGSHRSPLLGLVVAYQVLLGEKNKKYDDNNTSLSQFVLFAERQIEIS